MTEGMILDLFAGAGGWAEGLRVLGLSALGIETEPTRARQRRLRDTTAYRRM